ncbi:hypothetical protein SLEP1_g27065 [Rubroshorea leprosula]|uniref:Sodium/calcium exchanger membrane region domain-containing protein n=1 Tax=Rubroshorea leprosula TaxID=152421 RepID=A0AAV5JS25_9ROSI|nr:hypothetical protein SLEP1_g27065 [Rubroshorea leprosula]
MLTRHLFPSFLFLLLLLLLVFPLVHSRFVSTSDLVSDGVHHRTGSPFLLLNPFAAEESSCDQTYGFMPCTTTALGNLFLILVYGYLMYLAATYLSNGSELLLQILGPGIIGGLFLPILGALPDALLILVECCLPGLHFTQSLMRDRSIHLTVDEGQLSNGGNLPLHQ